MLLEVSVRESLVYVRPKVKTIDAKNTADVRKAFQELDVSGHNVLLDFHDVTFVDSPGLGALLSLVRTVSFGGNRVGVCNLQPSVLVVFRLVRMDRVLPIFDTEEAAMRSLSTTYERFV